MRAQRRLLWLTGKPAAPEVSKREAQPESPTAPPIRQTKETELQQATPKRPPSVAVENEVAMRRAFEQLGQAQHRGNSLGFRYRGAAHQRLELRNQEPHL